MPSSTCASVRVSPPRLRGAGCREQSHPAGGGRDDGPDCRRRAASAKKLTGREAVATHRACRGGHMYVTQARAPRQAERASRRSAFADWVVVAAGWILGVVVTGVGAGLAVRHLQKTGLSPVAILGVLVLVAGLVTLTWSVRTAWRTSSHMRHTRWVRAVALVCGAVVVFSLGSSAALAAMYVFVPP